SKPRFLPASNSPCVRIKLNHFTLAIWPPERQCNCGRKLLTRNISDGSVPNKEHRKLGHSSSTIRTEQTTNGSHRGYHVNPVIMYPSTVRLSTYRVPNSRVSAGAAFLTHSFTPSTGCSSAQNPLDFCALRQRQRGDNQMTTSITKSLFLRHGHSALSARKCLNPLS